MGAADEAELEKRDARAKRRGNRGSTNNRDRLAQFKAERQDHKADWGRCDPARIQAVVVRIGWLGGAVTFGYSRDGGAHFLTLLLDQDRTTLWFNGGATLDDELDTVLDKLDVLIDQETSVK